jgi:hypothetical protein
MALLRLWCADPLSDRMPGWSAADYTLKAPVGGGRWVRCDRLDTFATVLAALEQGDATEGTGSLPNNQVSRSHSHLVLAQRQGRS